MTKETVKIMDTTLRDGEQTPGIAFSPEEKLRVARKLDELKVDMIEAGSVATSSGEREAIELIAGEGLDAEICTYVRGMRSDIDMALDCDVDMIHLVVPTSDLHLEKKLGKSREEVKEIAVEAAWYALDHDLMVEISSEDATRSDRDFLREVLQAGIDEGARSACVCDTVGVITPERIQDLFSYLSDLKAILATHCHDDFGLATANTIASVRGGAREAHVTVNGLGERAGNASLEEVVLALSQLYEYEVNVKLEGLYELSKLVEDVSELPISPTKAVVGDNAFSHEAGIHTHGVLASPSTYEPIPPELVGQKRRLVFGKHVGSHAIKSELEKRDLKPTDEEVDEIFRKVKDLGDRGKLVTDAEWSAIVDKVMGRTLEEIIKLEELTVTSGNKITPTASVRLDVRGTKMREAGVGIGPVDAAINAIRKVVEEISSIKLREYHVDAISGGTDAVVGVVVKLTDGRRAITSRGSSEDIIMASVEAVLNGVNRLLWDKEMGGS